MKVDCNNCAFCSPTEQEQTKQKESHMCTLLHCVLKHYGKHPCISPSAFCAGTFYVERNDTK